MGRVESRAELGWSLAVRCSGRPQCGWARLGWAGWVDLQALDRLWLASKRHGHLSDYILITVCYFPKG